MEGATACDGLHQQYLSPQHHAQCTLHKAVLWVLVMDHPHRTVMKWIKTQCRLIKSILPKSPQSQRVSASVVGKYNSP